MLVDKQNKYYHDCLYKTIFNGDINLFQYFIEKLPYFEIQKNKLDILIRSIGNGNIDIVKIALDYLNPSQSNLNSVLSLINHTLSGEFTLMNAFNDNPDKDLIIGYIKDNVFLNDENISILKSIASKLF